MGKYILIIKHIFESCITGPAKIQNIQLDIDIDFIMMNENAIVLLVYIIKQ